MLHFRKLGSQSPRLLLILIPKEEVVVFDLLPVNVSHRKTILYESTAEDFFSSSLNPLKRTLDKALYVT
jgi:hypothetical protein